MSNQFFIGGKYHEIYRAEMSFSFSHVFHHVFLITIICSSFDSVQICRYFIYFDVTHAANEDWPRVCEAFLLVFCFYFDHQLVKALYSPTVTLAFCSPAATKNR